MPSLQAGGATSARNSLHQSSPSAGCCQQLLPPAANGSRALRGAEFEDHAPPEDEKAFLSDGGELVATLAVELRDAVGVVDAGAAAAAPGGADDTDSDGSDLLKSSRHLLHSVVPLLLNTSTIGSHTPAPGGPPPSGASGAGGVYAPRIPPGGGPPRLPRSGAAPAASAVDHPQHSQHLGGGVASESSQQHAAATRRSTLIRGLTRDSFLLNNTTGGGTTAASGYMLRTATGRGELIHVDASWIPFHMGNPLQVRIGELLGRGGCGSVYRGQWHGRPVAIKVVQQIVAPPAGAAAAVAAVATGGGAALPPPTITPLIDFFGSSSGTSPHDLDNNPNVNSEAGMKGRDGGRGGAAAAAATAGGGAAAGPRAPYLPDAHASVKRLRHPNVLRTYAYAVLSAAPQLGGVLPARHEHHVVLELCEGGSLRSWLDTIYLNGGPSAGSGAVAAAAALAAAEGGSRDAPTAAEATATATTVAIGWEAPQRPLAAPPALHVGVGGGGVNQDAMVAAQMAARSALERAQAHLNAGRTGPSLTGGPSKGGAAATGVGGRGVAGNPAVLGTELLDELQQLQLVHQLNQQFEQQQQQQQQQHQYRHHPQSRLGLPPGRTAAAADAIAAQPDTAPRRAQCAPGPMHAGADAAPDRPPAAAGCAAATAAAATAAEAEAVQRISHAGGGDGDGDACCIRSSRLSTEAVSRCLPGLTPAQSEQLQLLGMAWVSDGQVGLQGACPVSGGSGGRFSGGGNGANAWMADGIDGADGVAVSAMSEPSTGAEHNGRMGAVAANECGGSGGSPRRQRGRCNAVGGEAPAPPRRRRSSSQSQSPPSSPPCSPLGPTWAFATLRANASVGSACGSTMVRPESSSCIAFHAVQQHCVVLDDYLDDEDSDGATANGTGADGGSAGVDSSSGLFGGNAVLFGDLRLHARLGLLEEGSGEGRQSTHSRCASGAVTTTSTAATTTHTNTTAVNGGADAHPLQRHPTHNSVMSSSGAVGAIIGGTTTVGGSGAASAVSTGASTAAAAALNPTPSAGQSIGSAGGGPPLDSRPSPLGQWMGACSATHQPAAPPRCVPSSPLVDATAASASASGGASRESAQGRLLRPGPGQQPLGRQVQVAPPPQGPQPPLGPPPAPGAQPQPLPQGPPQCPLGPQPPQEPRAHRPPPPPLGPQPPAAPADLETSAATALLNRRAVGMVNSILRAAAGAAAASSAAGGAAAATTAPAEPLQPSQLRHLVMALRCLAEIASGLSYLHAVGMVHGDVKSGNVLLKLDPRQPRGFVLKLADFGFSRVLEHGSHTYLSRPSGTLAYLSPEMVTSYRQSAAADLYAFGLLVWELVTTQPLFRGLQTPQLLYAKTHNADWQYLQWPAWCPPEVRALARRCTDYHPAARLTAAEARTQLEAMRAHYQAVLSRSPDDATEGAPAAAAATATTEAAAAAAVAAAPAPAPERA